MHQDNEKRAAHNNGSYPIRVSKVMLLILFDYILINIAGKSRTTHSRGPLIAIE
jgi:hypothetical protein